MKESYRHLLTLAISQGGLFTCAQALSLGVARPQQSRYVASGEWTREMHGIYRMTALPESDPINSQYHLWMLWSIGRDGKSQAAFGYETALAIYELSDFQPSKIHISVPREFRRAIVPRILFLHKEDRDFNGEIWDWEGLRVVRPFQTIVDIVREERVSSEHAERGFIDGLKKGLMTQEDTVYPSLTPRERRLFAVWSEKRSA